jgi:D-alanine-D-alanine ligase
MRVAVIYNQPTPAASREHWRRVTPARLLPPNARNIAEFAVLHQVEAVTRALAEGGHDPVALGIDSLAQLADFLAETRPEIIFNCCESLKRNAAGEAKVAAAYERLAIPFTGSSALTLAISLNKAYAKAGLAASGIRTPCGRVFSPDAPLQTPKLRFPMIVKPLCEDAGIGIDADSVVHTETGLFRRIRFIWEELDQPALVEEFIDGRELNVAVLATAPDRLIPLPISEIIFSESLAPAGRIVGYEAKWLLDSEYYRATTPRCPAVVPAALARAAKAVALRAARVLGVRDYARIDMRVRSRDNALFVLEANPNPDIGFDSGFVRSSLASGRTHSRLILAILRHAAERNGLSYTVEATVRAS